MTTLAPYIFWQEFDNSGLPLTGGLVYTYAAGTTTPKATYTDSTGGTPNANPVVLDSAGRAAIWLGDGGYKFVIKTSAGATISTVDNVGGAVSTAYGSSCEEIATNTAIASTDANKAYIATAALTLSPLAVATAGEGFYFSVYAQGGAVTIDPNGAETINNASTLTVQQGASALVISDGDEWWAFYNGPSHDGTNSFTGTNSFSGQTNFTGKIVTPDDGELTIASGEITATGVFHTVDTEGDAASDNLDTISGGTDGQILVLRTENSARNVILTTSGNIQVGCLMETTSDIVVLQYDGTLSKWLVLSMPLLDEDAMTTDSATQPPSQQSVKAYVDTTAGAVVTQGTKVATTSGTTVGFSGLPTGIVHIKIALSGVSINGTSDIELALGDSGGIETSGYTGSVTRGTSTIAVTQFPTDAFTLVASTAASYVISGALDLVLVDSATNTWVISGVLANEETARTFHLAGTKALSGTLDRFQLQSANGTDTFDAGMMNIVYYR